MSSLRRVVSDSDSESGNDSEEETPKRKANRKLVVSPQEEEEPSKVSDSELEPGSDSEEERTKSKAYGKQQRLSKQRHDEEEEDEIESESESGSDQDTKPEPVARPQPRSKNAKKGTKAKGAVKVPLVTISVSGKRGRDANGANGVKGGGSTEEPLGKKMRQAAGKDDKARSQVEKYPLSPAKSPSKKERKMEQTTRGSTKGTVSVAAKAEKAIPTVVALAASKLENSKVQAAGRKRKATTPPPAGARQQQKVEGDKSPPKPKKPFSWSSAVEESLVNHLYEDCLNDVAIPHTKLDSYWEKLLKRLPLEEDLTGMQLCDKVRRMRQRYFTLKDRANADGVRLFKSPHEEKMYQLWTQIWDSGPKVSQPTAEVEHSDDESAETAATTAPRESSKAAARQSNGEVSKDAATKRNGEVSNDVDTQGKEEASMSDDEEEEEIELTQREAVGVDAFNATTKVVPEPVADAPFISKPRLAYTPLPPREGKSKLSKRVEDVISDHHTEEGPVTDDEGKGDVVSSGDHLKLVKEEMVRFAQELGSSFFLGIEEQRNGSLTGGLGNFAHAGSLFVSGVLGALGGGSGSPEARELQKKWRELKIQELALVSKRLNLMQEHCRLQQEELMLQNHTTDE